MMCLFRRCGTVAYALKVANKHSGTKFASAFKTALSGKTEVDGLDDYAKLNFGASNTTHFQSENKKLIFDASKVEAGNGKCCDFCCSDDPELTDEEVEQLLTQLRSMPTPEAEVSLEDYEMRALGGQNNEQDQDQEQEDEV